MTEKSTKQEAEEALIVKTLTGAGWKKTVKGERLGKADMEYHNGEVTLEIEGSLKPGWINFSVFDTPEEGSDFAIHCPDKLADVLNAVISFQDKISFDDYKQYLIQLLNVCSEIYVDTGDELVPLDDDGGDDA